LSAAFKEAYLELVPEFERATGSKVTSLMGAQRQDHEPAPGRRDRRCRDPVCSLARRADQAGGDYEGGALRSREMRKLVLPFGPALQVPGIDLVGPLPPDVQEMTVFSAGVHVAAKVPDAARALIEFFTAQNAAPVIRRKGLELI
jgi:hypothetical protein